LLEIPDYDYVLAYIAKKQMSFCHRLMFYAFCHLSMLVAAPPNGTQFDRDDSLEEEIQSYTNEGDIPWAAGVN